MFAVLLILNYIIMNIIKKVIIINLLFICALVTAQSSTNNLLALNSSAKLGVFEFKSEIVDYGTIKQNSDGKRVFVFKNTGDSPIIISKVKGSCGCTVPTKPDQPILPGETAEIGVKYATNRIGKFNKSITITSNASEATKVIRIKGEVIKTKSK